MRWILTLVVMTTAFFALPESASAQAVCGAEYFDGIAARLSAIEARPVVGAPAAYARDRELASIAGAPGAPLRLATQAPCPAQTRAIAVRDLAHQRVLALWAHVLALRAVDAPVYPAAYERACLAWDVRSWQVAFIAAWAESARREASYSAEEIARAFENDPDYPHVRALALERARRLRITALPRVAEASEGWLSANERALDGSAPARGSRCGPAADLWALGRRDAAPVQTTAESGAP